MRDERKERREESEAREKRERGRETLTAWLHRGDEAERGVAMATEWGSNYQQSILIRTTLNK